MAKLNSTPRIPLQDLFKALIPAVPGSEDNDVWNQLKIEDIEKVLLRIVSVRLPEGSTNPVTPTGGSIQNGILINPPDPWVLGFAPFDSVNPNNVELWICRYDINTLPGASNPIKYSTPSKWLE